MTTVIGNVSGELCLSQPLLRESCPRDDEKTWEDGKMEPGTSTFKRTPEHGTGVTGHIGPSLQARAATAPRRQTQDYGET